jgi:putative ABC transport system permease protein
MMTPLEVKRKRPVTLIRLGHRGSMFAGADPLDKQIKIAGVPFTVVGVSKKKGAAFGQSLDEFAVIPLGAYRSCSARGSRWR